MSEAFLPQLDTADDDDTQSDGDTHSSRMASPCTATLRFVDIGLLRMLDAGENTVFLIVAGNERIQPRMCDNK